MSFVVQPDEQMFIKTSEKNESSIIMMWCPHGDLVGVKISHYLLEKTICFFLLLAFTERVEINNKGIFAPQVFVIKI